MYTFEQITVQMSTDSLVPKLFAKLCKKTKGNNITNILMAKPRH